MAGSYIGKYDTTAANNTATGTGSVSIAEGMLPSNVNNAMRDIMADIRQWYNSAEWIEYGDGAGSYTPAYASGTSFTIASADVTSAYHVGRRVKAVGSSTGTIYGSITATSFSTNTTVTVSWDSGSLSSESLTIYIGITSATNTSMPETPSITGDYTLDVSGDIILDADGGDVFFKDGGTTFGSATNSSGNLIIKSGTTTALTFSGANATLAGDLTISGDDLTMGTNTSGMLLVADGTNFNPVAVSGDVTMASNGAVTIASTAVENSMLAGSIADSKLSTISTAGKVDIGALEIDGASDIGANLADADLIIVDDGANGTEKKAAMSRVATYIQAGISGDISISSGTAAIGSGVIVNADVNASAAIADSKLATISTADKVSGAAIQVDGATDGTSITVADADKFLVDDAGTTKYITASQLNTYTSGSVAADNIATGDAAVTIATSSGDITIDATANNSDIIFKGTDATSDITMLTLDGSEAGHATFNSHVSVGGSNNELRFYEGANYIGFEAPALSGDQIWVLPAADGSSDQVLKTDGSGNLGWASVTGTITALNNQSANRLTTIGSTTTQLDGEANLTFTGSALTCIGTITVGVDDTGHDVKFFGATASRYWLWDESADGVVQQGTLTVGVDDTGYDVKFFGATASAYMQWDESEDDLILGGAARIVVPEGQLVLGSTAVSSTAAELNLLDGVSGLVQADLTKLAAVNSTDAELNLLDGSAKSTSSITVADADALIIIDGSTTKQIPASDMKTYIGGGTSWQAVKTANFTAAAGQGVFCNTTSSAFTITLPAGTIGDEVSIIDYAGTFDSNNLTVAANGSEKIHGSTDNLTVATERAAFTLVFTDSTQGWLLKDK